MAITDYEAKSYTLEGKTRKVFVRGSGPAVIVMHELPGMTPECLALGDRLVSRGFSVYLPLFFGSAGQKSSSLRNLGYLVRFCISREWNALALGVTSRVANWVRALARQAHQECGGKGIGAIGMCLTGSFVIPLLLDPVVLAPVSLQPARPFPLTRSRRRDLGVSPNDIECARERLEQVKLTILGCRFTNDGLCPPEKFDEMSRCFGAAFERIEIDSSQGNLHQIDPKAHSVLTGDYCDAEDHPTRQAFERVVELFTQRLLG